MKISIYSFIKSMYIFAMIFVVSTVSYTVYLEFVNIEVSNTMPKIYEISLGNEAWAGLQGISYLGKSEIFSEIDNADLYIMDSRNNGNLLDSGKKRHISFMGLLSKIVKYKAEMKLKSTLELIDEYRAWNRNFKHTLSEKYKKVTNFTYTLENTPRNGFVYICRGVGVRHDGTSDIFEEKFSGKYAEFLSDERDVHAFT